MKRTFAALLAAVAFLSCGMGAAEAASKPKADVVKIVRNPETSGKSKKSEKTTVTKNVTSAASISKTATKKETAKTSTQTATKTVNSSVSQSLGKEIEVGLLTQQTTVSLTCLSHVKVEADGKVWKTFQKGTNLSVSLDGKQIAVNGTRAGSTVILKPTADGAAFSVNGNRYRGEMKLFPSKSGSGFTVVNALPLEDYLMGVVPCEVSPSWHREALAAQAVAARTYAFFHMDGYRESGFDVTDDTACQVYRGVSAETAETNEAVRRTAGEVVTYQGQVIDAVFHANGGGATENCENVWGSKVPYLKGVKEEAYSVLDKAWTKTVSQETFQNNLGIGTLKSIKLSQLVRGKSTGADRGVSGRVLTFTVVGAKKEVRTTGDRMQALYGLPSTLFDIKVSGKNVVFTGYGAGHGLGLSQWGAQAMAEKYGNGKECYKKILTHYYTGTTVKKVY